MLAGRLPEFYENDVGLFVPWGKHVGLLGQRRRIPY
jgi:hypothetical protein